jgi:hypothetical protein
MLLPLLPLLLLPQVVFSNLETKGPGPEPGSVHGQPPINSYLMYPCTCAAAAAAAGPGSCPVQQQHQRF